MAAKKKATKKKRTFRLPADVDNIGVQLLGGFFGAMQVMKNQSIEMGSYYMRGKYLKARERKAAKAKPVRKAA